jgi:hypothetical protein
MELNDEQKEAAIRLPSRTIDDDGYSVPAPC